MSNANGSWAHFTHCAKRNGYGFCSCKPEQSTEQFIEERTVAAIAAFLRGLPSDEYREAAIGLAFRIERGDWRKP